MKFLPLLFAVLYFASVRADDGYNRPEEGAGTPAADRSVIGSSAFDTAKYPRLKWLDSHAGEGDAPTEPFVPISLNGATRAIRILGRELVLGTNGLPVAYRSYFNGSNTGLVETPRELLRNPFSFPGADGARGFRWISLSPTEVKWESVGSAASVTGTLSFEGFCSFHIRTAARGPVALEVALSADAAKYWMGLGRRGGVFPESFSWSWDVSRHQDAAWFGDVNAGMMIRLKDDAYTHPLVNAYYKWKPLRLPDSWGTAGSVDAFRLPEGACVRFRAVPDGSRMRDFAFDLFLTPFKPVDLAKHVADRYHHFGQHCDKADFKALAAEGVSVVNLHHNTIWNPYINYPYSEDGAPYLKAAVRDAHAAGLRLKVYYTTREITQNMPEFAALAALGGEVVYRRPKHVEGWHVTNPSGPHPWLVENVGDDILPAWRETIDFPSAAYRPKPDLAVITTPGTRWDNFYLAGLEHLVKAFGIDGIYVDDTALDRSSMMRARRILDADGNKGRRIDMHSWNHFCDLAGYASSAVVYMELYPFADRLWYGEGFGADETPEYWLVERSGIPFGLLSEQLEHVSEMRGMIFCMTARRGWGGRPETWWKWFDEAGIGSAEMIGWWDPHCPVRTDNPSVRATVYRGKKPVVVFANFGSVKTSFKPRFDWRSLGFDGPADVSYADIRPLQEPRSFDANAEITLEHGGGAVLEIRDKR